ncbi:N-acetylmuramoyl-L-alanine amidase [Clostridium polyendosporum]|uniref:N-acetylmuramoyl-L-alanine amidase n=1 Tax=Clostridium polyendosporum TaxID=69208 RepID=A0A919RZW0_9CLOT|nr:peptidoglycan recognition family protein [Clostridium polyendosporum]GIM28028.1 N-acetylmuramoyl-L-alanine amidase [Clostridium polyendosporum]
MRELEKIYLNIRKTKHSLKIIEVKYKWQGELEYTLNPQMIIFHHTVEQNKTPQHIHELHLKRGWAGIGYHFYIRKDGKIYRGRAENSVGAHAGAYNNVALGIALEGNFMIEKPTKKQINSLILLSRHLVQKYAITDLLRHKDIMDTQCPGVNFPFEEVKNKVPVSNIRTLE